jgi:hypothetical protein
MKRRIMVLTVTTIVAISAMLMLASPALALSGAAGTNADCAVCHKGAALRSGVPAAEFAAKVNYTKCRTCHWLTGRTRVGYYTHRHQAATACYACHAGYSSGPAYYPNVRTVDGYFASTSYRELSAAEMHRIHARGSWPQSGTPAACASCHAPAACDACHSVPSAHSAHAYNNTSKDPINAPASTMVTRGTPEGLAEAVTAKIQPLSCVNARCHVVSDGGSAVSKPDCDSCHAAVSTFSVTPAPAVRPSRVARRR